MQTTIVKRGYSPPAAKGVRGGLSPIRMTMESMQVGDWFYFDELPDSEFRSGREDTLRTRARQVAYALNFRITTYRAEGGRLVCKRVA